MESLSPASRPAPETSYRWITDYIASLPREEEAFLNEATLAQVTGTSRTPVREALLRLEAEGLVKRIPHKGAYVPSISDADVRANLQARCVIEQWAVNDMRCFGRQSIAFLEELLAEQGRAISDPTRFIELDIDFHDAMVSAAGNTVLAGFYSSLRDRQRRIGIQAIRASPKRATDVLIEHQAILEALTGHDSTASRLAIAKHLDSTREAIVGH
jgi:DNA-binding GntR family transcriptional regulator